MNKFVSKILYAIILMLLVMAPANAMAKLDILMNDQPEPAALFGEANIMPGNIVTRDIKISNSDVYVYRIETRADNVSDNDGLGEKMELTIKDHNTNIVYFFGTLDDFFSLDSNIVDFPDIAPGESRQYDYSVYFKKEIDDDYQGKTLSFDIVIVSETDEEKIDEEKNIVTTSSGNSQFLNNRTPEKSFLARLMENDFSAPPETSKADENVVVKGIEYSVLDPTGFSNKEFIVLIIFTSSFFIISWRLRKKYL